MAAIKMIETHISKDGTVKFLSELSDGNRIETVLMYHDYGCSVCVTSQAGCNMGCRFCASGLLKKSRDLTAEEMLAQVMLAQTYASTNQAVVSHIVVMGTGEPFDNYDEVLRFCDLISDEKNIREAAGNESIWEVALQESAPEERILQAVAPRHITVSTCGIVPKIYEFAATKKRFHLAISLHAPDNEIRDRLMPVNRKYGIEKLLRAAADYCKATKRRVTFEYILLDGINDDSGCAEKLAALLNGGYLEMSEAADEKVETGVLTAEEQQAAKEFAAKYFYVNLIPYNIVNEFGLKGSDKTKALAFYDILMKNGIKATLRKERGSDISAACGQLRIRS